MSEWKQNLPHIIGVALLLFALLLVLTRVGIVGCGTFGASYCDIYYALFGKPSILVVSDPTGPGMGDPVALTRYLEDVKRLNVRTITIDQLSPGMLDKYDVVIVEHARDIPTSKLKIFYDYVINGMGRLVWIGDAGTVVGSRDQICKELDYTVKWTDSQGTKETSKTADICIGPSDLNLYGNFTTSEFSLSAKTGLYDKAWESLSQMCSDAFGGHLVHVKYAQGYLCQDPRKGYTAVYFKWENEDDFSESVSPWDRGRFKLLGQQGSLPGVEFGRDILGVAFISDAYAVEEYTRFSSQISQLRNLFADAHSALVNCTSDVGSCQGQSALVNCTSDVGSCQGQSELENAKDALDDEIRSVKVSLASDISELQSIAQQEETKNQTSQALRIQGVANLLSRNKDNISPDNLSFLDDARSDLLTAAGYETDSIVRDELRNIADKLKNYKQSIEERALAVSKLESQSEEWQGGSFIDQYSKATGVSGDILFSLTSLANNPSDDDLLGFITKVRSGYYDQALQRLKSDTFCSASSYFAQAIEMAKSIENPAESNRALAILKVEDTEHPLVYGISQSITLEDKYGNPVPFVLVATGSDYTHVVASLDITPAYRGERQWPAITVRDPKYGSHVFGRGVVIYYAFPPEISPVLMSNLVNFILY